MELFELRGFVFMGADGAPTAIVPRRLTTKRIAMKRGNSHSQKVTPPNTPVPSNASHPQKNEAATDQIKRNQEALGVDEDHRTKDMKKGHRGTFP
jgi:hypothetical protein